MRGSSALAQMNTLSHVKTPCIYTMRCDPFFADKDNSYMSDQIVLALPDLIIKLSHYLQQQ